MSNKVRNSRKRKQVLEVESNRKHEEQHNVSLKGSTPRRLLPLTVLGRQSLTYLLR